jgi:siroheme synthase-like protein
LDLGGQPCLVVGGGPVAARKVRSLLEAGARVTVVAVEVVPAIAAAAGAVSAEEGGAGSVVAVERRPYRRGEAARYRLVVTATGDPTVDGAVVGEARAAGVPVNSADGERPGTVKLPAVLRRGPVTVAVSTGGGSPALARWLRDRIAASLPPELEIMASLLEEARSELLTAGRPAQAVDWAGLIDDEVLPRLTEGHVEEARAALRAGWQQSG